PATARLRDRPRVPERAGDPGRHGLPARAGRAEAGGPRRRLPPQREPPRSLRRLPGRRRHHHLDAAWLCGRGVGTARPRAWRAGGHGPLPDGGARAPAGTRLDGAKMTFPRWFWDTFRRG